MVRSKRIRKFKLKLMAAAGAGLAAVILACVFFFLLLGRPGRRAEKAEQPEAHVLEILEDGTARSIRHTPAGQEAAREKAEPGKSGEDPGVSAGKRDPSLRKPQDDDSNQDRHSAVEDYLLPGEKPETVYLTFDDGPSVFTGRILDILSENRVRATFFVCGTGDRDASLKPYYRRIVEEGHTIGLHSYSHVYSEVYSTLQGFQDDLDKIRNLIYNETGVAPKFYRFPGGSGNTVAKLPMEQYISVLYSQDMEYYDWNVYCGDASGRGLSKEEIVRNTLNGVDSQKTSVVLMHDTGAKWATVEALSEIIAGLKERNLEILPMNHDTPPLHQFLTGAEKEEM